MDIKIFKTKKSFKKGGMHINLHIYWGISLCIAFIIILAAFILGFYLFKKINKELISSTGDNNTQVQTMNKERIDNVLEYFSTREQKSVEILNSSSPIVDPSL